MISSKGLSRLGATKNCISRRLAGEMNSRSAVNGARVAGA